MTAKAQGRAKVVRTSEGLRNAIFDELDDLRDGISNPSKANATAKLAASIIDTVNMELEVHRTLGKMTTAEASTPKSLPSVALTAA